MNAVIVLVGLAFLIVSVSAGTFIAYKTRHDLHKTDKRIADLAKAVDDKHLEKYGRRAEKLHGLKVVKGGGG